MDGSHVGSLLDRMKPPNANLDGTKMVNLTAEDNSGFEATNGTKMFGEGSASSSSLSNIKPKDVQIDAKANVKN